MQFTRYNEDSKKDEQYEDQAVLLKQCANYSDEFDTEGFVVISKTDLELELADIKRMDEAIELSFGSNESLIFENGKDLLESLTWSYITDDEAKTLHRLFGNQAFGIIRY